MTAMQILSLIVGLCGGLALFLYGMNVMSNSLEKMAGGSLERNLKKATRNPFLGLLLGFIVTGIIQSSSATTVMLVGLVNSGIMQFSQTVSVTMGANIGTTVTAWLVSMQVIDNKQWYIAILNPKYFCAFLALIGIVILMLSKSNKRKNFGGILVGFAVLMFGMDMMSGATAILKDSGWFAKIVSSFNNPLVGLAFGLVLTCVIQSSSASVGILQSLSTTGVITYGMAIPIIMGQNIGTCITAIISCIGANRSARRVAVSHLLFNCIGTVIFFVFYLFTFKFFDAFGLFGTVVGPVQIALVHFLFNVGTVLILFPAQKLLIKLTEKIVPIKDSGSETQNFLDDRLLATPAFAVSECQIRVAEMSEIAKSSTVGAFDIAENYDPAIAKKITDDETKLDEYEDKIAAYLVKITSKHLSEEDSMLTTKMLHVIGDFERMGDHALNILHSIEEMRGKKIKFSEESLQEQKVLFAALRDIIGRTVSAYKNSSVKEATEIEPLEQVIDGLVGKLRLAHIERLKKGKCTVELGFILSDILNDCERISDHCSNIAVAIIEVSHKTIDSHEYLRSVKDMSNEDFRQKYEGYSKQYQL